MDCLLDIDWEPKGGDDSGELFAAGTPEDIVYTRKHLKAAQ